MSRSQYPIAQGSRGRGTLDLVFDGVTPLDSRITFTRASTGTYVNSAGVIATAAQNEMRLDFDPVTLACRGLLIEEARTNLLLRSAEFDDAAWVKTFSSATANATTSPDSTSNADKLVEDTTVTTGHYLQQLVTIVTATAYTGSIYLKAGERTRADVLVYRGATFAGISVNLADGTFAAPQTAGVSSLFSTATVLPAGSGWYRVILPFTSDGVQGTVRPMLSNGATTTYTGNGTSGIFLWAAQLEAGAFATSYISTVASQVTRAADVPVMTGGNFSSWYRQDEGTFVVSYDVASPATTGYDRVFDANDSSSSNQIAFLKQNGSGAYYAAVTTGGVAQAFPATAAIAANAACRSAFSYKMNDFALSHNGGAAVTDVAGTVPTSINRFGFADQAGGVTGAMHISRLTYYPTRLTNAQIQSLSAL